MLQLACGAQAELFDLHSDFQREATLHISEGGEWVLKLLLADSEHDEQSTVRLEARDAD